MFNSIFFALALAQCLLISAAGATQVYRCNTNGAVQFQQSPCQSGDSPLRPTVEDLNATRQKQRTIEKTQVPAPAAATRPLPPITQPTPTNPSYKCDGRKYCTQMSSCAEAKFFLSNCPGVKMDGDRDGIPCEEQWCH
jgi:hypothetical protein